MLGPAVTGRRDLRARREPLGERVVALLSRTDTRHAAYRDALAEAGITAEAFVADVRDRGRLLAALDAITERNSPEATFNALTR